MNHDKWTECLEDIFENHCLIQFIDAYDALHSYHKFSLGMIAIGKNGQVAVATSTNGATHKIPG